MPDISKFFEFFEIALTSGSQTVHLRLNKKHGRTEQPGTQPDKILNESTCKHHISFKIKKKKMKKRINNLALFVKFSLNESSRVHLRLNFEYK